MKCSGILAATLTLGACAGAGASTMVLTTADRGWVSSTGTANDTLNYVAGESGIITRNWFAFDLSGIGGDIESATFSVLIDSVFGASGSGLYEFREYSEPVSSLTSRVGGVGIFDELGAGVTLGSIEFNEALQGQMVSIVLNSDGLAMLNSAIGGVAALGGLVVDDLTLPFHEIGTFFGASSGLTPMLTLEVNEDGDNGGGDGGMGVIPLPGAAGLGGAGLALLIVRRRRSL